MNRELLRMVDSIHRDRQVDKEIIFTGIEQALISAAQKRYGATEELDVQVNIDRETGEIEASIDGEELTPQDFGRIAALSGKQVLLQKIREAEREVVFAEYEPKIGSMMSGTIQSKKPGGVLIVSLGKVEGIIPRSEQSQAENFNEGDRIKFILAEVNLQTNRVQLVCSRAHPDLVRRLFELEIPEVADEVVEIKAISREAGHRTKIAVATSDPNVDCVGACVGVKGSRIRNIVDELFGEKIDIVRWHDAIEDLIVESLRPAEIASLELDFDNKAATVFVKPEQQSLAIGRRGQNVRLASKLTEWDLDITPITEEELDQMRREDMESRADGLFNERLAQIEQAEATEQPTEDRLDELIQAAAVAEVEEVREAEVEEERSEEAFDAALREAAASKDAPADEASTLDQLNSDALDAAFEASAQPSVSFELNRLPGIDTLTEAGLREAGLDSPEKILAGGVDALVAVEGIAAEHAQQIIDYLESEEAAP